MTFKFIHTADWHIGKAFASFEPEKASVLREARFTAVERIVGHARAFGAGHVLVAGDIFDSPGLPDATLRKLLARLKAAPDLDWFLLPGNHDPDRERGVWQRLARAAQVKTDTQLLKKIRKVDVAELCRVDLDLSRVGIRRPEPARSRVRGKQTA